MAAELPPGYRLQFQTAKDLIISFAYDLLIKETIKTGSELNSSYAKIFKQFRNIIENVKILNASPLTCTKISTYTDFFKGSAQNKHFTNTDFINKIFTATQRN